MSVGSQSDRRTSITWALRSAPIWCTTSDLPMPGGPHRKIGRFLSIAWRMLFLAFLGVTVRFAVSMFISLWTGCFATLCCYYTAYKHTSQRLFSRFFNFFDLVIAFTNPYFLTSPLNRLSSTAFLSLVTTILLFVR